MGEAPSRDIMPPSNTSISKAEYEATRKRLNDLQRPSKRVTEPFPIVRDPHAEDPEFSNEPSSAPPSRDRVGRQEVNEEHFHKDALRLEGRIMDDIRELAAGTKLVAMVEADFRKLSTARERFLERLCSERVRVDARHQEEAAVWSSRVAAANAAADVRVAEIRDTHAAEVRAITQKDGDTRHADLQKLEKVRKECSLEISLHRKRCNKELDEEKGKLANERDSLREEMEKELIRREAIIEARMQKEREEEMEMVIQKLDAEFSDAKRRVEEKCERRLDDQRDASSREIEDIRKGLMDRMRILEEGELRLHEQCEDSTAIQVSLEAEVVKGKEKMTRLEEELRVKREEVVVVRESAKVSQDTQAVQHSKQVDELKKQISTLQETYGKVEAQLSSAHDKLASERAQSKEEIATLKSRKNKELEEVALRVRQTVAKKDAIIQGLKQQLNDAEMSVRELMSE